MSTFRTISVAVLCVVTLSVTTVRAQQQGQDQTGSSQPIPAYHSPLAGAADNDDATDSGTQEMTPDTRSLSGVQDFSLGESSTRSYWQPRFDVTASADSNPGEGANNSAWGAWTALSGGIDVRRTAGNSAMSLSYTGGGMFSTESSVSNGIVQSLSFSDKYSFRRVSVAFFEQLSYLPESALGFPGLGSNPLPGAGSLGLGAGFGAGQTILTGRQQNLASSSFVEVDTYLTPRTSLTFVGGYSLLHNFETGLIDYGDTSFRAGYNYQMTRKDTIGAQYTFSALSFTGTSNQSINEHTMQATYGRRVTGRLAFQIAAGPQLVFSQTPILGTPGTSGEGTGTGVMSSSAQLFWSLSTSLTWQVNRTGMGLSYSHGVAGGSGVLTGSLSDVVTGTVTRKASRTFTSGITGGYSRNQGVAVGTSTTSSTQTYDYWFGGATLAHPIGRALGLTLSYQLQYQDSNSVFCDGPTCGTNVIRHVITFGVGWHERPLLF